ncbi:MAG TPA: alpha/beta hydrolase [Acidimicrobiia bacterium]|jgi:pimeloyl-ACP methyl ester carboxylesterase|nr:alpha/beta hydrolase [Acidimicrobiia bacterium]
MDLEATPTLAERADWWRLGPGLVLLLTPALVAITSWDAVRFSHPAYAMVLGLTASAGALLMWLGTRGSLRRSDRARILGRAVLVVLALALSGIAWILRPAAATEVAIAAMADGPDVAVTQSATTILMRPVGEQRTTGLIFYPGGLVEPRAYANILRPLAAAGYPITIVKPPLGLAVFAAGTAGSIASPGDVVAGHSLGGVVAADAAADDADLVGLVLWASFPADNIAGRPNLATLSVFGSEDGLTTPAQVTESRSDLPAATEFAEITGAVHSHFGDYGDQAGDGTPTLSRADAQAEIVAATLALLDQVEAEAAP